MLDEIRVFGDYMCGTGSYDWEELLALMREQKDTVAEAARVRLPDHLTVYTLTLLGSEWRASWKAHVEE